MSSMLTMIKRQDACARFPYFENLINLLLCSKVQCQRRRLYCWLSIAKKS